MQHNSQELKDVLLGACGTVNFDSSKKAPKVNEILPDGTMEAREMLDKVLKICRRRTVDGNLLAGSRMNKIKIRGMQRHAVNQSLVGFLVMIFSIADQRMAHGKKLCANLVL